MGGAGEVVSPQETEADYESDFELDKVDSSGFSIREGVKELVFFNQWDSFSLFVFQNPPFYVGLPT